MLTFDEYQKNASTTAIYPNRGNNIYYPTLGLCGEAGEVAEKVKKIMRDNNGQLDDDRKIALKKEIGDILWYVAALCSEINVNMSEIAQQNLDKLRDRAERGKLQGSGDTR